MIGILGGTFDPIHYGHLRTALDVQQQLSLNEVRFIPCGEPPHRNKPVAEPLQRLAMVRAAISGQDNFSVDDREISRAGPSYMVDTLKSLKQELSSDSLNLILGTDAFNELPGWYKWQEIFNLANIIVMQRPQLKERNARSAALSAVIKQTQVSKDSLYKYQQGKLCFVPVTQLDISATVIRQQWQEQKNIRFYLPDTVLTLIRQQNIY